MKSETVILHITAGTESGGASSLAVAGGLTLHCTHIQNRNEVVVTLNPSVTDYTADSIELTHTEETTFMVFDIHERQMQSVTREGVRYEIEFLTWDRVDKDTLRFDFEVRYE